MSKHIIDISQRDVTVKVSIFSLSSTYLLAASCGILWRQVRLQVGAASSASLTKLLTLSHAWRRRGGHGLILHLAAHGDEDWLMFRTCCDVHCLHDILKNPDKQYEPTI